MRHFKIFGYFLVLVLVAWVQGSALALERSDILLDIVRHCVDPQVGDYCSLCRAPRADAACNAPTACNKTTEVWALTSSYTALRDIKMCGCPSDFVHGLALPRAVVRGVEDPNRPDGIWQFAWDVGASRIEPQNMALVVNPQFQRSQNQLHVHMLRLSPDARARLEGMKFTAVSDLGSVWASAARSAAAQGWADYGVIVVQRAPQDFMVVATPDSPEDAFTQWRCN